MEYETRKLPKKTMIYLVILLIAGIISMFIVKDGKAKKATKILTELGYTNITNVSVSQKTKFAHVETNIRGFRYAVTFTDLTTNKQCRGFILKDFKRNIDKDLECK